MNIPFKIMNVNPDINFEIKKTCLSLFLYNEVFVVITEIN